MAPWMTHLRIADGLLEWARERNLDLPSFAFGNLAPDGGVPGEDGYVPDKSVTHFGRTSSGHDYEGFFRNYLLKATDGKERSFYWGYYAHLVTDERWAMEMLYPLRENLWGEEYRKVTFAARDEWVELDKAFLQNGRTSPAWELIDAMEDFPERYMEFYPEEAFPGLLRRVKAHCQSSPAEREYIYMSREGMDAFVERTQGELRRRIAEIEERMN